MNNFIKQLMEYTFWGFLVFIWFSPGLDIIFDSKENKTSVSIEKKETPVKKKDDNEIKSDW